MKQKIVSIIKYLLIYYLSMKMIVFAIPKLLHMQFRVLNWESYAPLAEISKYEHMWSFFGRSYNYNLFIGLAELTIGILIVFKRTRLIALLISFAVCTNILILNIEFEVFFALNHVLLDLLATILLLIPYMPDLYRYFILQSGKTSMEATQPTSKIARFAPMAFVSILTIGYFFYAVQLKNNFLKDKIEGAYIIKELLIDNEPQKLKRGDRGNEPMLFFEYTGQIAFSVNDSIHLGYYSFKDNAFSAGIHIPGHFRNIKGEFNEDEISGKGNGDHSIKIKLKRIDASQNYLQDLHN